MGIYIDSSEIDFEFIMMFLIVFAVIAVILGVIMASKRTLEVQAAPIKRVSATVAEKQPVSQSQMNTQSWVTFQLGNGTRIRLVVPDRASLVVGDKGMLVYQGTAFRSFERTSV